ncbi:MAG: hypothetical protein R2746_06605 [Acidimicrobiales bacterium]|nr:hypothetical protein [Actinomycetota bacterium]
MRRRSPAVLLSIAVALAVLASCGPDEAGTALAIRSTRWDRAGRLVATTECADAVRAEVVGDDVRITGTPKVGRCRPQVVLEVPPGTRSVTDAATGMVVDLPAPPAT